MTQRPPPAAGSRPIPTTGPEPPTSEPAPRTWRTRWRDLWLRVRARWSFLSRSLLFRVVVLTLTLSTLVMLVLGLVYTQYLPRRERAIELFRAALLRLHDAKQREFAEAELLRLESTPPAPPP